MSEARHGSPSTYLGAAKTVGKIRNSLLRADDATTRLLEPFQVRTRYWPCGSPVATCGRLTVISSPDEDAGDLHGCT